VPVIAPSDVRRRLLALMDDAVGCDEAARSHALACEAVALARAGAVDDALLGRACLLQADFSYRLFDYAGSYERALEATDLLGRSGDEERRAAAANLCLVICIETGDLTRALDYARRELELARRNGDVAHLAQLLHNQAVVFDIMEEYEAAVPCLVESAALHAASADGAHGAFFACVNLAALHVTHADRLMSAGDVQGAQRARDAAREALPEIDFDANFAALQSWISVKAQLGDIGAARAGALGYLRLVRRAGHVQRYATYALLAMAEYHVQAGRRDKGAHRLQRAIAKLRKARNGSHLSLTEARLASVYAEAGDHANALKWMRQAHVDRARLQDEQHRLRCRLAAIEREAEPRRAKRREAVAHAQRLAVIGRMMAEIYHALAGPLERTQRLIAPWVRQDGTADLSPVTEEALKQVIVAIDEAAALVRQLKMFSYRAAPQPMEVDLEAAVREAWVGLALWRRSGAQPLVLQTDGRTVVHVDAQRLGVLLRILLIEVGKIEPLDAVRVRLDSDESEVCMHVACSQGSADKGSAVGVALCEEIAQEMGGQLARVAVAPQAAMQFELCLPASAGG